MVAGGGIEEDSSRNLLQRFGGNPAGDSPPDAGGGGGNDGCEIELSLGLSLNGCFGVEPRNKKLVRSSSISSLSIFPTEHNVPLTRTCSLPTETAEERWRRKEMENFKRMEAKRKRSEKKAAKDRKDENFDEDLNHDNNNKGGQALSGKMNGVVVNGEVGRWVMGKGVNGGKPISQGSIGSQGSSSSGVSEFDSKPIQGLDDVSGSGNGAEVKSPPATILSASSNPVNHKSATVNPPRDGEEPSRKKSCRTKGVKECERSMMEEMPCVSAKGDGPNGRRIEGFLYKYRRGEEVRILCVCHGKFFTPAEFVKHAGGGDVAHPLRHIVVNPTPSAFL